MKKVLTHFTRVLIIACVCAASFALQACSSPESEGAAPAPALAPKQEILNLEGTWKQVNSKSDTSWHEAIIKGDLITVNWVTDSGDTRALFWEGSYSAPSEPSKTYTWTSEGNRELMDHSLLASQEQTKEFNFDGQYLSYEFSALGVSSLAKLERQS